MKKYFWIFMAVCAILMTGCEKNVGNDLVKVPENTWGSLDMYYYNGERMAKGEISDETVQAEIFAKLSAVPAEKAADWSPEKVKPPVYGVKFGMGEDAIEAAWSDGYWIAKDGEVYSYDYNFSKLWDGYDWENKSYGYNLGTVLPCSYYICRDENDWIYDLLPAAEEPTETPENITALPLKMEGGKLTVEFTNSSEIEEWTFGEFCELHVWLDKWYELPRLPGDWAFIALGYLVMPGQTLTHDFDISSYGELPEGVYRLEADTFLLEFYVNDSGEFSSIDDTYTGNDEEYFYINGTNLTTDTLEAAGAPPSMEGISAIVAAQDENSLTVRLTNRNYKYGEEIFEYGVPFHVEVLLGKKWYKVPTKDIDFGFPMPLYGLARGETKEIIYNFFMYDKFPEGRYRVVNGDEFWVEFTADTKIIPQNCLANDVVESVTISYFDEYIDGSNSVIMEYIDKSSEISEILSIISAEPAEKAENWSGSMVKAPIFGISAVDANGWAFEGAWTNGYWINQYGEAYRLDLDIEQLKRRIVQYETKSIHKNGSIAWLCCGTHLCKDENGWIAEYLLPSDGLSEAPENISAEISRQTENSVTVTYANSGKWDWTYGEHFSLSVQLGGVWYDVPEKPGNWLFNDIGYNLEAGRVCEMTYDFHMYGELPAGHYKISANSFELEFDYDKDLFGMLSDEVAETGV